MVLHQTVKEAVDLDFNIAWDLTIEQLPPVRYYAMGHVHLRRDLKVGDAFLAYPGSIERYDSREASHFIHYRENLELKEGEKKGFYLVEDFKPVFLTIETRDLYNISIEDEKREEVQRKFLSSLELVKDSGIIIAKLYCGETLDQKKFNELALKKAKYAEISFRRRDIGEISQSKPEREFFSDFELKLLEILKEDDEISIRTAVELIKEHYAIAPVSKAEKVEKSVVVGEEKTAKDEKKFEGRGKSSKHCSISYDR